MKPNCFLLFFVFSFQILLAQQSCYLLDELDEKPVYLDTLSFTEHVLRTWKHPDTLGESANINGGYVISMNIDTLGHITNIKILRDLGCKRCLANLYEILNTAKSFTPPKKNGKPVCLSFVFKIPYDGNIMRFQLPFPYLNSRDKNEEMKDTKSVKESGKVT